jgi:hypothetical protein
MIYKLALWIAYQIGLQNIINFVDTIFQRDLTSYLYTHYLFNNHLKVSNQVSLLSTTYTSKYILNYLTKHIHLKLNGPT